MSANSEFVVGSLRISETHLEELQDGRPIHSIARSEIQSGHVRYGIMARNPVLLAGFSIVMSLVSGWVLLICFRIYTGNVIAFVGFLSVSFVALGLWTVMDAFRQGHFVEVWTTSGRRRLIIGHHLDPAQSEALSAALNFGRA